tara:strand:+ start:269 stop:535 length:267 start_codon:yes stop_codon:yes gene_type:complete
MDLTTIKTGAAGVQELVDALHEQHRTTQALLAETMCKALAQWATECHGQNRTDLRNERAVSKVMNMLQTTDLCKYESGDLSHLNMYTC